LEGPFFIPLTNFAAFHRAAEGTPSQVVLTSPEIATASPWNELIVSWNAVTPLGAGMKFQVRALYSDHATAFYTMGLWADDTAEQPRESVNGQKDEDGDVLTDTLVLKRPAHRVQVRVSWSAADQRSQPQLKFLGLSFANSAAPGKPSPPNKAAWGKLIPVPERSQLAYEAGRDWCSPTSVSMVLAHWAAVLKRPELNIDVPEVAAGVYDKNWPGTGNWPFNTAFAGKFPGLRAYVTRLRDAADLEAWVAAGVPPVVSVSYGLLYGRPLPGASGHLVVCVGFTEDGAVILNDPWAAPGKGERVRTVVPRRNLLKAWAHSRQTTYLIYPEGWPVPDH
jgi:hypothetical protein